jgi:hypothetical protein
MPNVHETWTVLEHGDLEELQPNLWRVEGAIPGMQMKRVMTVARRSDGVLVIHNGIGLPEDMMKAIESKGEVGFIVVPNGYHRLDAKPYKARYPKAKVLCPKAAQKKVAEVIPVDLTYDEFPADDAVELRHLAGCKDREGVMIVRHEDQVTLVFNDAVMNMPHLPGFAGFVLRRLTSSTGGPTVSRLTKMAMISDKRAFFEDLDRLADLPGLQRIVVSHHEVIDEDPASVLRSLAHG